MLDQQKFNKNKSEPTNNFLQIYRTKFVRSK